MPVFQIVDTDNIRETFTGAASTTISLGGAAQNSNPAISKLANGDTSWWVARAGAEFSEGLFTFNTGTPNTLTQTAVWKSSNGNAPVAFSLGATGEAYIDLPGRVLDTLNLAEIAVPTASTCDIGAAQGLRVALSNTVTVNSFGPSPNKLRIVRHSGEILTHDPVSLILLGGTSRNPTAANDIGMYVSDATGKWRELFYNAAAAANRERLAGGRTYYVRSDGNDSNTGLVNSAGGAFLTIQKAIDTVSGLDIGTQNVTIQVGDALTYGPVLVNGPWLGSGIVTLLGNTGTPANVVITNPTAGASAVTAQGGGRLTIKGFKVVANGGGAGSAGLKAATGGSILFESIDFGACSRQIQAAGATVQWTGGTYNISAGAVNHWFTSAGGSIIVEGATINTAGAPAFSSAFANISNLGIAFVDGNTFTGTGATGSRYAVVGNGVLYTAGAATTYLPGNAVGTTGTGGQYV